MGFRSLAEVQAFVRLLDVPEERREVVEAELLDHFFARVADGASEADALAAFGSEDVLRTRFEIIDGGFEITRGEALRDGFRASAAWLFASMVAWLFYNVAFAGGMGRFLFLSEASRANPQGVVLHAAILVAGLLLSLRSRLPAARGRVRIEADAMLLYFLAACAGPLLSMSAPWITGLGRLSLVVTGWNDPTVEGVYGAVSAFLAGPLVATLAMVNFRSALFPSVSSRTRADA